MTAIDNALKQLRGEGLFAQVFGETATELVVDCSIYITDLETGAALQVCEETDCSHSVGGKTVCPLCGQLTWGLVQKKWRGVFRIENGHAEQVEWKTRPYLPMEMKPSMAQKICAALSR